MHGPVVHLERVVHGEAVATRRLLRVLERARRLARARRLQQVGAHLTADEAAASRRALHPRLHLLVVELPTRTFGCTRTHAHAAIESRNHAHEKAKNNTWRAQRVGRACSARAGEHVWCDTHLLLFDCARPVLFEGLGKKVAIVHRPALRDALAAVVGGVIMLVVWPQVIERLHVGVISARSTDCVWRNILLGRGACCHALA